MVGPFQELIFFICMFVTKKVLEELKKQLNQERDKEDKECSSEQEDSNKKGRMPTGDIKIMLYYWEEFQSLATKWHPNRAEMNRLCALDEGQCLNHFKNILKKSSINFRQIFYFSFSKETEEEETCLEQTLKI